MELIRLTTEDEKAFFRSRFNTDIIIPPLSQVALQNFSAEIVQDQLVVSAGQRQIQIQLQPDSTADGRVTALLNVQDAPFSTSNWAEFLLDLENSLNYAIAFTVTDDSNTLLAIEFAADVNQQLKTDIQYRYSIYNYHSDLLRRTDTINNPNPGHYVATVQTPGYENSVLAQEPLSRGQGIWRCQLGTLTNAGGAADQNGFLIGVSRKLLANRQPKLFTEVDGVADTILFAVGVTFTNGTLTFFIQEGAVQTILAEAPNYVGADSDENDFLEIQKIGDRLEAYRYKHNEANRDLLGFQQINFKADSTYYPFCTFKAPGSVRNLAWTPTPYTPVNLGATPLAVPAGFPDAMVVPRRTEPMRIQLGFETKKIAEWLGYEVERVGAIPDVQLEFESTKYDGAETTSTLLRGSAPSDNLFKPRAQDPHLMVELLSNPIESYDSQPGVRKSLLSTMIRYQPDGKIQTEPPRTFIDLGNAQPINLKNVEVRLVDNSYQPVSVRGRSIATLLIKERGEAA